MIGACPLACGSRCCQFKQLCIDDAGTCVSDFDPDRRPYCEPCGGATCGTGANFCVQSGLGSFCGADCSAGQACPAGYECQDVRVVNTNHACAPSNPFCISNKGQPCSGPEDCPRGVCASDGFCAGECLRDAPGSTKGHCSCLVDDDCAQDVCTSGVCSVSRGPCDAGIPCPRVHCVALPTESGLRGACHVGQNCLPAPGLTCAQVR